MKLQLEPQSCMASQDYPASHGSHINAVVTGANPASQARAHAPSVKPCHAAKEHPELYPVLQRM